MATIYYVDDYADIGYVNATAISIDWLTRVIYIPKTEMSLIQEYPSQIRELDLNNFRLALKDLEDNADGMVWPTTHSHVPPLTVGGVTLARVVEIINDYTITFEDGQYAVNLVGANSNVADRINPNQVSVRSANSAGLVALTEIYEATEASRMLIEVMRPHHVGTGKVYYWKPNTGDNSLNGKTPGKACKTFAHIHNNLITDYGHDIIIVLPDNPGGSTVILEPMSFTKNFLFVRAMGFNAHLHPTATTSNGNLVDVLGRGIEMAGFHIEGINIAAPNCNGINVTNGNLLLKSSTVEECTGHGIVVTSTMPDDRSIIEACFIRENFKSGMQYNSGNHLMVFDTEFEENGEHGVDLTGAGATEDVLFHHCNFLRNAGYGLKINNANVVGTNIESECFFDDNGLGDYLDNGTNTTIQALAEATGTAAAVWQRQLEGLTAEGIMRITLAALAGKREGLGTAQEKYMGQDGVTPRITFTPDSNGNGTPVLNGAP